jgi:hypothetical protein
MALVLANRVQESGTANTTVSFTLTGAVPGFQSFAVIGNTNTTYYSATDASGNWEVGVGTYSTTGPTLDRTTVYASSNSGSAVTFSGAVNVFVTYPSGRSVNLNETGNVSALGTVSSGTWQGSTVGVAYGGTGVTASSGANSVVLRDANENITVNRLNQGLQNITASGGVTTLTAASDFNQLLTGTGNHTFRLPDATTLTDTTAFQFNNAATGTLTVQNNAGTTVGAVTTGGSANAVLISNATVGGTWEFHGYLPEGVTWGTNALDLGTTVISNGTWQGGTIQPAYGGTGLTTFAGANNALYSTGASTLVAGTLPVAAGGTGLTSYTLNGVVYASGTGTLTTGSALTFDGTNLGVGGAFSGAITSSRINPRSSSSASPATITPDIQANDQYSVTALANALTINAPTGTPVDGNKLLFRILDNGTARALTWDATYTAIGTTLPTTTTVNKTTYVGCVYNANNTRWDVVDVNIQGYNAIGDIFFRTSLDSENLLPCQGQRISKANYPALSGILPDFFNFAATTQTTRQFRGIAFNGSVFCSVVGGGSASNVAVTSPDGVTWTARTLPSTVAWQDIAWNGSVFFACAGGPTSTSVAATSPDGITWTSRILPSIATWSRVIWNGTQFLAIATNSTAAATSTDGITWTARTLPSASAWGAIAWNGSEYLIVIQSSSSAITSPDGITWTTRTMPAASGWITLAANNSIFCAFRQNTTEAYTSSDNGVTWTRRFLPVSANWTVLKWVNNAFFALGQGGTTLLRSTDGISWFAYTVNSQTWGGTNNIEFGNSTLVALTANGTGGFAGSFDSADYQAPFAGVSLGLYVVIRAR